MNRKKLTALLLSSIMAVTPAMPAMADQSTVSDYVEATAGQEPLMRNMQKQFWIIRNSL